MEWSDECNICCCKQYTAEFIKTLQVIQKMNLITVNDEKFISMVDTTSDLGDLGEATLVVDNKVQPKTLPCRKLAQTINDRVKPELYKLVDRGIRVPVTTPTRLVSQMAGSTKLMEN